MFAQNVKKTEQNRPALNILLHFNFFDFISLAESSLLVCLLSFPFVSCRNAVLTMAND